MFFLKPHVENLSGHGCPENASGRAKIFTERSEPRRGEQAMRRRKNLRASSIRGLDMRLFIAIDIPKELKTQLQKLQDALAKSHADVKWVNSDNIHITMKFLGETQDEKIEKLKIFLDEITKKTQAFRIRVGTLGAFPGPGSPRVIWVGVTKGEDQLSALAGLIDAACDKLGFDPETRPFSSHLTIGRVRSPKNRDKVKELILKTPFEFSEDVAVNIITLYQSTLSKTGSTYTVLHKSDLSN